MRRRPTLPVVVLALLLWSAACGGDGRELRAPTERQRRDMPSSTQTPASDDTSGDAMGTVPGAEPFTVSIVGVPNGGVLPDAMACGKPFPAIRWEHVPTGTVELALSVVDVNATAPDGKRQFVHWVISGLRPEPAELASGVVPAGAIEARNSSGSVGWTPPCPPAGDPPHRYTFTLYASTAPFTVMPELDGSAVIDALLGTGPATTSTDATYQLP